MNADRSPAKLPAVERQIVLLRANAARIGLHALHIFGHGRAEWVVRRVPALAVGVPGEHRELMDPDVRQDRRIAQAQPLPHLEANVAERLGGGDSVGIGDDEHQVSG